MFISQTNMNNPTPKIKYFAYSRKSSEGEEKQALSIDSQKENIKKVFPDLEVVEILEERCSAFIPDNRPVFADMIRRIKRGEATGIIAWHPDRLSRNEVDASTITYLTRTGVIADLKFVSYNFDNSPEGIMMLQLALSQSQYFSSKLGKDVKRGLYSKVSMGWRPGIAPEGYLNDMSLEKGQREIIIDTGRFVLLRKAFDLMLSGAHTAQEVLNTLNNKWGYTTRKRKKMGGGQLSRSAWYKMLASPFYAGTIVYNGKESPGKHMPMITVDEYNRIQELLGVKGCKRRPKEKNFAFSGMFKCGVCGCSITAEHKTKFIKSEKIIRGYDYYHCTHKKKEIDCKQGSVAESNITDEILEKLDKLKMHALFLEWALDYLDSQKGQQKAESKEIKANNDKKMTELEAQLSGLTRMRAKDLIDDAEFLQEKGQLKTEIGKLQSAKLNKTEETDLIELTKEKFIFSAYAKTKFIKGGDTEKREILADLGYNHEINDKKVLISVYNWLMPIFESAEIHNAKLEGLEPLNIGSDYRKSEALTSLNLSWLGNRDSNPN